MNDEVNKNLCSRCTHQNVCAYKVDYLAAERAISKFADYFSISCKHYKNWTVLYRNQMEGADS